MFDKFGEFDSYTEINELADNLLNEGDTGSIRDLAKENGIPEDYVEMFLQGDIPALCDSLTAAIGKIEAEMAELKPQELLSDWTEYIKGQCMENNLMAHNVRKKGKTLKGCIGEILKWSFKNAIPVDKEIIKAAGIKGASSVKLGIPGAARAKKIITDYYMKKEK